MLDRRLLFSQILKPSMGCTDPAAAALGVAAATQAISGWTPANPGAPVLVAEPAAVKSVRVVINRNLLKQSFAVPIPNGAGHRGLLMAAALGVFCDPRRDLELFSDLDARRLRAAEEIVASGAVQVSVHPSVKAELYVDAAVTLETAAGRISGAAGIRREHGNIVSLARGSATLFSKAASGGGDTGTDELEDLRAMTIGELTAMVEDLPESDVALIRRTIEMNLAACEFGQARPLGLGAGYHAAHDGEAPDTFHLAANMAAAGSDARMSGYPVPVMSSAGSGNQGIIATIPVVVYARKRGIDERRILRAVALSHLITMYLTAHIGYLSALCGVAIKAGIGAACGIAYADGGGPDEVGRAVKVMAASLAGMICDGAKTGCALKVGTASDMAIRSAILAGRNVDVPDDSGIVGVTAEETVRNLAALGSSMDAVDDKILEIMTAKLETRPERLV